MNNSPTLICLTPVKNEAWILDCFLQCASTWADHIIVADQLSTDGSKDIARSYDKVKLIHNDAEEFNEPERQKLLIEAAREVPVDGKRIMIALDADEMLSANWMTSDEWEQICDAPEGTVLRFQWANVGPGVEMGWLDSGFKPFGFVDDGSPHVGRPIHSPRIPVPQDAPELVLREIKVLHYQYADWERMKSKQRWYQCYERLEHPQKRPVVLYRQYHDMDVEREQAKPLDPAWLKGYEERGIDMRSLPSQKHYHWDKELIELFQRKGPERFSKLDVWDVDWPSLAQQLGHNTNGELRDPRSWFEKAVHHWLRKTQQHRNHPAVRAIQKLLQAVGW